MDKSVPQVIVNADDFGMSQSINRSIAKLFDVGAITSTTILLDQPGTKDALTIAMERPRLAIGLHLNLDRFFSFEVNGHYGMNMTDIDMQMYQHSTEKDSMALVQEIRSQMGAAARLGINITHVDGHHHVHLFPRVFPLVIQSMSLFGFTRMRLLRSFFGANLKAFELTRGLLDSQGIRYPTHFITYSCDESLTDIVESLGEGVTEIMVHTDLPGNDETDWRQCQFDLLKDKSNTCRIGNPKIKLISYADLE